MKQLSRLVSSLVMTLVTSLVLFCINHIVLHFTHIVQPGSLPFFNKNVKAMTAHETQIAQQIVQPSSISERMKTIGGLRRIKDDLEAQVLLPLKHPQIFFGPIKALHPPRGILLHGPPGVGKTMLARAIAAEASCPFLSLSLSQLENKYYGESSKLLGATFSLARKIQPCVIFFDEIDGMIRTRSDMDQACVYGFKTEFLTHMDGMHSKSSDAFIVIGCTNCVDKLDPAIKRRLPKQYKIEPPSSVELADIMSLYLQDSAVSTADIEKICDDIKPGCSGSDIAHIVREAWANQLQRHVRHDSFIGSLMDASTTAETVYETVGKLNASQLYDALSKNGLLRDDVDSIQDVTEVSDDEAAPPP